MARSKPMRHESSRTQQVRQTGRWATGPDLNAPVQATPIRIDEYGMTMGKAGEWLPDFDDLFDLEDEF